jgi:hypothetical protein
MEVIVLRNHIISHRTSPSRMVVHIIAHGGQRDIEHGTHMNIYQNGVEMKDSHGDAVLN